MGSELVLPCMLPPLILIHFNSQRLLRRLILHSGSLWLYLPACILHETGLLTLRIHAANKGVKLDYISVPWAS